MDLDFDSTSINQIHLVLFGFQDAVSSFPGAGAKEFFEASQNSLGWKRP